MRRRQTEDITDSGHDSFLDIVANLVGILVILIMVVGVRARHAWQTHPVADTPLVMVDEELESTALPSFDGEALPAAEAAEADESLDIVRQEIVLLTRQTAELQRDAHELHSKAATIAEQTAIKTAERDQLQLLASAIENEIQVQRDLLQENERAAFDQAQAIATAESELNDTKSKIHTVSLETLAPTELTHHPTPLAKTVFGREEHLRLQGGLVVRVPLDELVQSLRDDAQTKMWKMRDANAITESLPPLQGFRMKYTMKRFDRIVDTPTGKARSRSIELDRFTLFPVAEDMGEPVGQAVASNSTLNQQLARLSPDDTSVTIWTYPDSFSEFRVLQDYLIDRGFKVAARPLPQGHPIGGSPNGSRSASQ